MQLVVVVAVGAVIGALLFNMLATEGSVPVLHRKVTPAKTLPKGFVVWSSNRQAGNHEIYKMSLPDKKIQRLTQHPYADYFPRISPDGTKIVFSRSRQKKVSQRDHLPWDVVLLDLQTGKESVLARFANTPTWSPDGKKVYFQRKVVEFVEHNLETGKEKIIFKSGRGKVNAGTGLQTPHFSPDTERLAVTLRYAQNFAAIVDSRGELQRIADGCELTWGPKGEFLYLVDYGGRMETAIYVYEPGRPKPEVWLDLPGKFSHEYFPKLSNDARYLVFGASRSAKAHEHDRADYEIFLWQVGTPANKAIRLTFNKSNDSWPDIYIYN